MSYYNKNKIITSKDIDRMIPRLNRLRDQYLFGYINDQDDIIRKDSRLYFYELNNKIEIEYRNWKEFGIDPDYKKLYKNIKTLLGMLRSILNIDILNIPN